ncbi:MAG: phosphoribosylamine--glycine ligase [Acidimicrobiaceae bacterium]|nr:phosphoribosylamine--glycine ligase [Acidimicrobiaceae bacterium]
MSARVLVIGSGGREHAIAWSLAKSPRVAEVIVAPGNGGTAVEHKCRNAAVAPTDVAGIVEFARTQTVAMVVVGPEDPLVMGLVDALDEAGIPAFGPSAAAAELEGSKSHCKEFLNANGIPTGDAAVFFDAAAALEHLEALSAVPVIKATGLAAGKGVIVAETKVEAAEAIRSMLLEDRFGEAGHEILLEERLRGTEVSVLAFCDGTDFRVMPLAQDHKRLLSGDGGPNTGGMGAFYPSPIATSELIDQVSREVLAPTLAALARQGRPYRGVLYAGMMLTDTGPKVIEFNCRFGDPETQVVLPLLESDLYEIFEACCAGELSTTDIGWADSAAVTVVMASAGYPVQSSASVPIAGLEAAAAAGCKVFHAGTSIGDGQSHTAGGRVLAVTALAPELSDASEAAYRGVAAVSFPGAQFRSDIGREVQT